MVYFILSTSLSDVDKINTTILPALFHVYFDVKFFIPPCGTLVLRLAEPAFADAKAVRKRKITSKCGGIY